MTRGVKGAQAAQRKSQSKKRDHGGASGTAECEEISRKDEGEGSDQEETDAEARRPGEQTGLDTLVVPAVNDETKMRKCQR